MRVLTVESITKQAGMIKPRRSVPFIRLKGDWLREAGIKAGNKIIVSVTNNQIIISHA